MTSTLILIIKIRVKHEAASARGPSFFAVQNKAPRPAVDHNKVWVYHAAEPLPTNKGETMRKTIIILSVAFLLAAVVGCGIFETTTQYPKQYFCPVTGNLNSAEFSTEYEGRTICFANAECVEQFGQDPEKYVRVLDLITASANQRCPVSDNGIDPDIFCEYRGRTVYFAGEEQRTEFKRGFEKFTPQIKALDAERGKVEGWIE